MLHIPIYALLIEEFPYRDRAKSLSNITITGSATERRIDGLFIWGSMIFIRAFAVNIVSVMHAISVTQRAICGYPGEMYWVQRL